jgi:hypothetical protein
MGLLPPPCGAGALVPEDCRSLRKRGLAPGRAGRPGAATSRALAPRSFEAGGSAAFKPNTLQWRPPK